MVLIAGAIPAMAILSLLTIAEVQAVVPTHEAYAVSTAPLVPSRGAWWGAWVAPLSGQTSAQAVSSFEATINRRLDIVHQYHAWDDAWPTATEYGWAAGGRILFGNASARESSGAVLTWTQIANGSQDSIINALAARLKAFGHPLFFSFDEEPEDRYHSNQSVYTLASYVAAYQHIHSLFAADGASNVVWVWNVSGYSGDEPIYPQLYPGDSNVDWIGWDPYNWFNCPVNTTNVWQSFDTIVAPFYNWVSAGHLSGGSAAKPYMLAEYGTVENTGSPTKGNWFTTEVSTLPNRPNLRAVVYFDQNVDCNWPITTSASSVAGFTAAGLNCYVDRAVSCGAPPPTRPPAAPPTTPPTTTAPHASPTAIQSPRPTQAPAAGATSHSPSPSAIQKTSSLTQPSDPLISWLQTHEYMLAIALVILVAGGLGAQYFTSRRVGKR